MQQAQMWPELAAEPEADSQFDGVGRMAEHGLGTPRCPAAPASAHRRPRDRRTEHLARHTRAFSALPPLQPELTRRCAQLAEDLAATTTADPLVISHRNLHGKQLLWDGSAIGLLDLDTRARAEAACDLANLAVHAELRTHQGLWTLDHRNVVLERVTEVAHTLEVSPRRLAAYAEATLDWDPRLTPRT